MNLVLLLVVENDLGVGMGFRKERRYLNKWYPELCKEWDYNKNPFGPDEVTDGSEKRAWWICKEGHSWRAIVYDRTGGRGCPYCSGNKIGYGNDLLTNHPDLCKQWDFEKNKLGPETYTPKSNHKAWWKCKEGHSWLAVVHTRTNGSNCPFCSNKRAGYGNDLLTNFPELCGEWDFQKNLLCPEKILPGTQKKVWWKCCKGHSWFAAVHSRTAGCGCPYCSNKKVGYGNDLLTNHPGLCEEWNFEKNKLGPENYTPGSEKKIWWRCSKGHDWTAQIFNRTGKGSGCPECTKHFTVSKISQKWLDQLGIEQREVQIDSYRVDGFDPETNTVYEFFGDYWHGNPKIFSAQVKNPSVNKTFGQLFREAKRRIFRLEKMGYKVVYIWESDFMRKGG